MQNCVCSSTFETPRPSPGLFQCSISLCLHEFWFLCFLSLPPPPLSLSLSPSLSSSAFSISVTCTVCVYYCLRSRLPSSLCLSLSLPVITLTLSSALPPLPNSLSLSRSLSPLISQQLLPRGFNGQIYLYLSLPVLNLPSSLASNPPRNWDVASCACSSN